MAMYFVFHGTALNERFDLADYDLYDPIHVEGGGGNDYVTGTSFRDFLAGDSGDDVILGMFGGDTIYGDTGAMGEGGNDQLYGGTGDDVIFGGGGNDYINAGHDRDLVNGGDGDDFIVGGLGADTLYGGAGNDILLGNGIPDDAPLPIVPMISVVFDGVTHDTIDPPEAYGGNLGEIPTVDDDASDLIYGGDGDDIMLGFGGSDQLCGGKNSDVLMGGLGNDYLDGGRGADYFVFAEFGAANGDKITKFQKIDHVLLETDVFSGIGKSGTTLKKKYFHKGTEAESKNDKIIYDKKSGTLFYDKDGSGDAYGMEAIATIQAGVKIKAAYIDLV